MKPVDNLIQRADDILAGNGPVTEDWRDAIELYKAATALDSDVAYYKLGIFYASDTFNKPNFEKSLFNYKQSLRLGYVPAAAGMAKIYNTTNDQTRCLKLWEFYFENIDTTNQNDVIENTLLYIWHTFNYHAPFKVYPSMEKFIVEIVSKFVSSTGDKISGYIEVASKLMLDYETEERAGNIALSTSIYENIIETRMLSNHYGNLLDHFKEGIAPLQQLYEKGIGGNES